VTALADRLRALSPAARDAIFARIAAKPGALSDLRHDWRGFWARDEQLVSVEEIQANGLIVFTGVRRSGKTRAVTETFNGEILAGRAKQPRIFAATMADIADTVIHGPSGIMACLPRHLRPRWYQDKGKAGKLVYRNGVEVLTFTSEVPEGCVGTGGDLDFYDDVAKWGSGTALTWSHARYSCSAGYACGLVATTRRGTAVLRKLLQGKTKGVLVKRPVDTRANRWNLNAKYFDQMAEELGGSLLFAQELEDQDIEGASPFASTDFSELRIATVPKLRAVGVWVDPATSSASYSCEVGVVAVGITEADVLVGLEDASAVMSAAEWPGVAVTLQEKWSAVAPTHLGIETNKGGNMGPELLRAEERIRRLRAGKPGVSVIEIRTAVAAKSKPMRAGPLARLAAAGQLRMCSGLTVLEGQLRELDDTGVAKSDRADAFVHAGVDLAKLDQEQEEKTDQLTGLGDANRAIGGVAAQGTRVSGDVTHLARAQSRGWSGGGGAKTL
jgi:phage terminase large subunit-like protein